jgi:hypothetical protein
MGAVIAQDNPATTMCNPHVGSKTSVGQAIVPMKLDDPPDYVGKVRVMLRVMDL